MWKGGWLPPLYSQNWRRTPIFKLETPPPPKKKKAGSEDKHFIMYHKPGMEMPPPHFTSEIRKPPNPEQTFK